MGREACDGSTLHDSPQRLLIALSTTISDERDGGPMQRMAGDDWLRDTADRSLLLAMPAVDSVHMAAIGD